MTIDINAYLGAFALRDLRCNTPEALIALMDRKGIDAALVSHASAITWKDCHRANELLADEVTNESRLIPCAVLNPAYAGWERDLNTCAHDLGMKALKLYPHWHGYALGDPCCDAIVRAATDRGLPVVLPMRAVDSRQLGWLFDVPDLPAADIAALARRHPTARFVVVNGIGVAGSALAPSDGEALGNCWIEISRMSLFIGCEIPRLLDNPGPERLLFGTGMPFKYVDPVLLKLEKLCAPEEAKRMIAGGSARSLLGVAEG